MIALALAPEAGAQTAGLAQRAGAAFAQAEARAEPPRAAPDSPRESMARFKDLARHARWDEAARYLELPSALRGDGARLARELSEVIDRNLGLDPEELSGDPMGDADDGLPPRTDALGEIPNGVAGFEAVRIVRREATDGARWVFTRATVQRADAWYARLGGRWAREHLPPSLLARGPRDLLWWQWLAFPLLALAALGAGRVVAALGRRALARAAGGRVAAFDPRLPDRVVGPLALLTASLALRAAVDALSLYRDAEDFVLGLLRALWLSAVFWAMWRSVEVSSRALAASRWAATAGSVTLLPLMTKAARVVLVVMAVVAVLSALGYPVASLVAGLGIGGLAIALAAQKTGENLFGTVAIGFDQAFQVGDQVKVDEQEGTVEAVGLRSTRIRTLDRTVISIPNGKLADMRTETFTARDRFRVHALLPLAVGTPTAAIRAVMAAAREALAAHPKIHDGALWVYFRRVGPASLDVEVSAWFRTTDFEEFLAIRSEVLMTLLEVVERCGARLAAPVAPAAPATAPRPA